MNRPLDIFRTLPPRDEAAIKEAQLQILDMVRVKIEAGEVASLAFLMCAKDPAVSGGPAPTSSRFLVSAHHLDIIDDVYHDTIEKLEKQYGITRNELRMQRARSADEKR